MTQLSDLLSSYIVSAADFLAIGDGVTPDSYAFERAVNKAISNESYAIKLQPGKTYLLKASEVATFNGVSIYGNGATIKLDGVVRFDLANLTKFACHDLIIETNYGMDEDDVYSANYMFYFSSNPNSVLYDMRNVYVKSTVSQTPKVSRYPYAFALSSTPVPGSEISNVFFENIATGIWLSDGEGVEISDIYGKNCETLVYLRDPVDVDVRNLAIKNTYAQSLTWIGKNQGQTSNGKDVLQVEGGSAITINDVYGEFCVERVIYCQSDNIKAHNLFAKDCAGFKFCGSSYDNRINKATINNLYKIVTDELTTIVDTSTFFDILQMYYITDAEVDVINLRNFRSDKLTQLGTYVISLADGIHNLKLKNIDCEYNSAQPLIYHFVLQDDTKTCSNVEVENFVIRNYGDGTGEYYVYRFGSTAPASWLDGLTIKNGEVIQKTDQVTGKDIARRGFDLATKKAINVSIEDVDLGYISNIDGFQSVDSALVSDHITKMETSYKNIIGASDNNYNLYYYSGYASGAGTLYFHKSKAENFGVNYKTHSSFEDTVRIKWQNLTNSAARLYDSVVEIEFNMLMDVSFTNWDLPLNIVGKTYLVEVESSSGCGKAIFVGATVTEVYKTGDLVFDSTALKLRVRPSAGTGTDYMININNAIAATTRVKVKITLLNTV